jgi:hypothetical protein
MSSAEKKEFDLFYEAVTAAAARVSLHNPDSERMEGFFSPHCCSRWFTTLLGLGG